MPSPEPEPEPEKRCGTCARRIEKMSALICGLDRRVVRRDGVCQKWEPTPENKEK